MYANGNDHAEFEIDTTGWYEGSVISFDITCSPDPEICGKEI